MSKHAKYVPTHRHVLDRATATPSALETPKRALRNTLMLSALAVTATGVAVSGGLIGHPISVSNAAEAVATTTTNPLLGTGTAPRVDLSDRGETVSRSDRRDTADPLKKAALQQIDGPAMTRTEDLSLADPREIGRALLSEFGYSADQFSCLDSLYTRESNWRYNADNPSSSAYGIPQALPGSKMSSSGADWATNPVTQIRWGLGYIQDRYGSPCGAWSHSESYGWY